jgi:hypothetical protein
VVLHSVMLMELILGQNIILMKQQQTKEIG